MGEGASSDKGIWVREGRQMGHVVETRGRGRDTGRHPGRWVTLSSTAGTGAIMRGAGPERT